MGKTKKRVVIIFISLILILLLVNGFSYARYVSGLVWNYYLGSKGFYFTSEELGTSLLKNVNNNWDGESTLFTVSNSLNESVISDYDINYKVVCQIENNINDYVCLVNGTDSNEFTGTLSVYKTCVNNTGDGVDVSNLNQIACETGGYVWNKQQAIKENYFDVVSKDGSIVKDVTVNIEVSSMAPYTKTLNGKFILHYNDSNDGKIDLTYNTYADYSRLVISNSHISNKCVDISFDTTKFLIDVDREDLSLYETDENGYIKKIKIGIGSKDSKSFRFYKVNNEAVFDDKVVILTEADGCN